MTEQGLEVRQSQNQERIDALYESLDADTRVLFNALSDPSILALDSFPGDPVDFFESLPKQNLSFFAEREVMLAQAAALREHEALIPPVQEIITEIERLLPKATRIANLIFENSISADPAGTIELGAIGGHIARSDVDYPSPDWNEHPDSVMVFARAVVRPAVREEFTTGTKGDRVSVPHSPFESLRNRVLAKLIAHENHLAEGVYRKKEIAQDIGDSAIVFDTQIEIASSSYADILSGEEIAVLSKSILGRDVNPHDPRWIHDITALADGIPPAFILLNAALVKSRQENRDPAALAVDEINPLTLEPPENEIRETIRGLLNGSGDYADMDQIVESLQSQLQTLLTRRYSPEEFTREQLSSAEIYASLALEDSESSILLPLLKKVHELGPEKADDPDRYIDTVWAVANHAVQSRIVAKHEQHSGKVAAIEHVASEKRAREEVKIQENTLHRQLDANEKFAHRMLIVFPEQAENRNPGVRYELRRNIAENVANLTMLYGLYPEQVSAEKYRTLFSLFTEYVPIRADQYLPRPSDLDSQSYSKDDYFSLYLEMHRCLTAEPIEEGSSFDKLRKELNNYLYFDIYDLGTDSGFADQVAELHDVIAAQSDLPIGKPDSIEKIMKKIYGPPKAKIDVRFLRKTATPLLFPKRIYPKGITHLAKRRLKTESEKAEEISRIDKLSHIFMAEMIEFARPGYLTSAEEDAKRGTQSLSYDRLVPMTYTAVFAGGEYEGQVPTLQDLQQSIIPSIMRVHPGYALKVRSAVNRDISVEGLVRMYAQEMSGKITRGG